MNGFLRFVFIALLLALPLQVLAQFGYPGHSDDISVPGSHSPQIRVVDVPEVRSVPRDATKDTPGAQVVDARQLSIPKKARKEYEKAVRDLENGKTPGAIAHFQNALKIAPDFYDAHFQLGLQYSKDDPAQAEQELTRAAELNPRVADPLVVLGFVYLYTGRFKDAIEVLDHAADMDPTPARALYYLGSALYETGQSSRAEKVLKRSFSLDPAIHLVHLALANIYLKEARYNEALRELEAYLKEEPQAPQSRAAARLRDQLRAHLQIRKSD